MPTESLTPETIRSELAICEAHFEAVAGEDAALKCDSSHQYHMSAVDHYYTALRQLLELQEAIRKHRDQRGDDRCYLDDDELYAALPEGKANADTRLHEPCAMLENCKRFIASRHDPALEYISPQREIEKLQEANARLERELAQAKEMLDDSLCYVVQCTCEHVLPHPDARKLAAETVNKIKQFTHPGSREFIL